MTADEIIIEKQINKKVAILKKELSGKNIESIDRDENEKVTVRFYDGQIFKCSGAIVDAAVIIPI